MADKLTPEQVREMARGVLQSRGRLVNGVCSVCLNDPETHVNPITQQYVGCGAARKGTLTGQPWVAEGRYELQINDFPRRAIRSEQERIAYSVVKSLSRTDRILTSARLSDANPTWTVRDAYRLLQSLMHRGILRRVPSDVGMEEPLEETGEVTATGEPHPATEVSGAVPPNAPQPPKPTGGQ